MYEDDFTFHIKENRSLKARLYILKKKKEKIGWMEHDFTFDVVLHPDGLTLFCKKKFNEPIFTKLT